MKWNSNIVLRLKTFILVLWLNSHQVKCDSYCPGIRNSSSVLKWSREPATLAIQCVGYYKEMYCCADNFKSLNWYQQKDGNWGPVVFSSGKNLSNHKQVLYIKETEFDRDQGNYSCVITGISGQTKSFDIELQLTECSDMHQVPSVLLPKWFPPTHVYKRMPGESINITCEAFFGNCDNGHDICAVDWLVKNNIIWGQNVNNRVYTTTFQEKSSVITPINLLQIKNITDQDYGNYSCNAYNSYGSVKRVIILKKGYAVDPIIKNKIPLKIILVIIFGICGGIILLLLLSVIVYKRIKLDMQLWWKENYMRPPKQDKKYDALIVYCQQDQELSRYLYAVLTERYKYKIFYPEIDINACDNELMAYENENQESHCTLFVISPDFFTDNMCQRIFQEFDQELERNFIFVIKTDINKIKNKLKSYRIGNDNINHEREEKLRKRILKVIGYSRRKFEWLPEWPTENLLNGDESKWKHQRKLKRFWKHMRCQLPTKCRKQEEFASECQDNTAVKRRITSTESGRGLLQSTDSDPADNICYSGDETGDFSAEEDKQSKDTGLGSSTEVTASTSSC